MVKNCRVKIAKETIIRETNGKYFVSQRTSTTASNGYQLSQNHYLKKTKILSFVIVIGQRTLLQLKFMEKRDFKIPLLCLKVFQKAVFRLQLHLLVKQLTKLLPLQEILIVMSYHYLNQMTKSIPFSSLKMQLHRIRIKKNRSG